MNSVVTEIRITENEWEVEAETMEKAIDAYKKVFGGPEDELDDE